MRSFNAAPKIATGDKASEDKEEEKIGDSGKTGTSATTSHVEAIDTRKTENSQPSDHHGPSSSVFAWLRKQQASRETVLFVVATTAVCALLLHRTKRSS